MNLYIDFDGTIYDTEKLYNNVINYLINNNISIERIENEIDGKPFVDLDKLANKLLNRKVNLDFIYNKNYVFEDVIPFLKKIRKYFKLILLTYGDNNYQLHKIMCSKLNEYFDDIIIVQEKKNSIQIDYCNGIFIDNNPLEIDGFVDSNAYTVIRIKRIEDKKYCSLKSKNKVKEFNKFDDNLIKYLLNIRGGKNE